MAVIDYIGGGWQLLTSISLAYPGPNENNPFWRECEGYSWNHRVATPRSHVSSREAEESRGILHSDSVPQTFAKLNIFRTPDDAIIAVVDRNGFLSARVAVGNLRSRVTSPSGARLRVDITNEIKRLQSHG